MSPLIRLSLRLGSVVILAVVLLFSAGIWAATQLQQDLCRTFPFRHSWSSPPTRVHRPASSTSR